MNRQADHAPAPMAAGLAEMRDGLREHLDREDGPGPAVAAGPAAAAGPALAPGPTVAPDTGPPAAAQALQQQLRERVKELLCLHGITELGLRHGQALEPVLQGIVELLPSSLQRPQHAWARLELAGRSYCSSGAEAPGPSLQAPIRVQGAAVGRLEIGYPAGCGEAAEVFLHEELLLLLTVAEHVGLVIGRARAEQELQQANAMLETERRALLEANAALRALTDRLHDEKRAVAETIRGNVSRTVGPLLDELQRDLPENHATCVKLLRRALDDLVSPFLEGLRAEGPNLTPTELAICVAIRGGLTTKEIAELRGIAAGTVSRHRENIRNKLGLRNADRNLASYLLALPLDPPPTEARR